MTPMQIIQQFQLDTTTDPNDFSIAADFCEDHGLFGLARTLREDTAFFLYSPPTHQEPPELDSIYPEHIYPLDVQFNYQGYGVGNLERGDGGYFVIGYGDEMSDDTGFGLGDAYGFGRIDGYGNGDGQGATDDHNIHTEGSGYGRAYDTGQGEGNGRGYGKGRSISYLDHDKAEPKQHGEGLGDEFYGFDFRYQEHGPGDDLTEFQQYAHQTHPSQQPHPPFK